MTDVSHGRSIKQTWWAVVNGSVCKFFLQIKPAMYGLRAISLFRLNPSNIYFINKLLKDQKRY